MCRLLYVAFRNVSSVVNSYLDHSIPIIIMYRLIFLCHVKALIIVTCVRIFYESAIYGAVQLFAITYLLRIARDVTAALISIAFYERELSM